MTGSEDMEECHFVVNGGKEKSGLFGIEECCWVLTGHRSANGLQCLFSSHMTPLASLPNLHSVSWTSFLSPHTPYMWLRYTLGFPLRQWLNCWCYQRKVSERVGVFLTEEQTGFWHLESAGVKQVWLNICVHTARTQFVTHASNRNICFRLIE